MSKCLPFLATGLMPKNCAVLLDGCEKTSPKLRKKSSDTTCMSIRIVQYNQYNYSNYSFLLFTQNFLKSKGSMV